MQQAGIPSFKALSRLAQVSEWQVEQLRQGKAAQMRADRLYQLSQALQLSLSQLLTYFSDLKEAHSPSNSRPEREPNEEPSGNESRTNLEQLQQEYQRLQAQLEQQREQIQQQMQQASLQILEPWLIQFPTAVYAAQQNPEIPATRLLPLMRPLDQWLKSWGIEAIASVGSEAPYDPHLHQLMEGNAQPGELVKIRYTGYRQGDKLLYRAKVSPIAR